MYEICRSAKENDVSNPELHRVGAQGKLPRKCFPKNCIKCADLHRKMRFVIPNPHKGGSGFQVPQKILC